MRFRKSRGKVKARVTLTEDDIVQACHDFLERNGYTLSDTCRLVVPIRDKIDSLGRKRRRGIEFQVDVERNGG